LNVSLRPVVLVIAGSDSSGGAGLVRDVQVLTNFEVDARCAVTSVTAQTNTHLAGAHHVPPQLLRLQISAALETGGVRAIKIGMLGTRATVEAVAEALPGRDDIPIVLDPVLASSSGGSLIDDAGLTVLREMLIPQVTLITPNLLEAAVLLGEKTAADQATLTGQAQRLLAIGPRAVLLKGGHAAGVESIDILVTQDPHASLYIRAPRLKATLRGTGCALSSAIAALLALGMPLQAACERAKRFVFERLQQAP
jgi:hydroxymethylpyrimidine/phosphomethylpyrimidine kinase